MEVLDKYKSRFGQDFADNKKALDDVTIIRSKGLKNEIAGYITKYIKHEVHDNQLKQAQEATEEMASVETKMEQASEKQPEKTNEITEPPDTTQTAEPPDTTQTAEPPDTTQTAEQKEPSSESVGN